MLTAVDVYPVSQGTFVNTELLRDAGDRARRLDHHLHGFVLEFRREALLRSRQFLHLSRHPILMDGLSGSLGAPHAVDFVVVALAFAQGGSGRSVPCSLLAVMVRGWRGLRRPPS